MNLHKQCRYACRCDDREDRLCRRCGEIVRADAIACEAFTLSARAFLDSIAHAERRLEGMSERAQHYRDMAMRATGSMDAVRVGGTSGRSKVESNMGRVIDIVRDIDKRAAQLRERYNLAMRMIENISDPIGREVLELRYLSRMRWEEIAEKLSYTTRNVTRLHGIALREIEAQLDQVF